MSTDSLTWLLFDLGNVLVDYRPGGLARAAEFFGVDEEQVGAFFGEGDLGEALGNGSVTPEEFVARFNSRFGRNAARETFVELFSVEIGPPYPGIPELIGKLKGAYSLGVLSNTFFGHWDYFITTELAKRFDALLPSHWLGYSKPDPRAYREALARIGAEPSEVLFVDDKEENVAGAQALGIRAFRSESPQETSAGLRRFGVDC